MKLRLGIEVLAVAIGLWGAETTVAAAEHVPFDGEKTAWHGFDRYDFVMDDATGAITPMKAPEKEVASNGIDVTLKDGKRRCVVVVPKKAAPGYPWSWRGCYWNHQPQTEVELLNRGFYIAYVAPDAGRQGKAWDRWYEFLTAKHGLSQKPAFVGMSKGGVNEFNWGVENPDKVACIYADNPALYDEDFAKIPDLAKHDIPLLHVCGSEDMLLQRHTLVIENIYHQWGGAITVIVKEGHAHHPHSLQNPKLIADWIEQHMQPVSANRPAFADQGFTKSHYYSLEPSFIYLKEEQTYATARGPGFAESYDRYDANRSSTFRSGGMAIVVPRTVAPGKPWVFRADAIDRNSTVDQALLAKGYHIVTPPLTEQAGMVEKQWDETYKTLVDNGFSKKPAMEGTGADAGEMYAWAIANPDKVSCLYARNPSLQSLMTKAPPIDNLAPLAKAGIPILHDSGSLDPWLSDQTRVVEKRYKELGGAFTLIIREGEGHFPVATKDPKAVVDFIVSHQR
jgi:pimeloyl-ACP methyl ester carboxylesterase